MKSYHEFATEIEDADTIHITQDETWFLIGGKITLHIDQIELLCKLLAETKEHLIELNKDWRHCLPIKKNEQLNG